MIQALLATLISTAAASAQHVDNDVNSLGIQRIDLSSTWGGLGIPRSYHATIKRQHGHLQLDGTTQSWAIVHRLIDALAAAPLRKPVVSTFGFAEQTTSIVRDSLRNCVGDAADLSPVNQMFSQMFFDGGNQAHFLTAYYSGKFWHTDDYPAERVEVVFVDGSRITAESNSQTQYMLPFTITKNGLPYKTFDPALPTALARLNPADVNYERLMGSRFFADYGDAICDFNRDQLNAKVIETFTPGIAQYVKDQKISIGSLDGLKLTPDLGSLDGTVHFPEWPTELTFGVSAAGAPLDAAATQAAGLRALEDARSDGSRVAALPWVASWFKGAEGASLLLTRLSASPFMVSSDEIEDELRRHSPGIYSAVVAAQGAVLYGMLWDKKSKMASDWLFLPDGRSVLVQFHATDSTLGPLTKSDVISWSSFARQENDATYPWRSTVTVINAMGTVIRP